MGGFRVPEDGTS